MDLGMVPRWFCFCNAQYCSGEHPSKLVSLRKKCSIKRYKSQGRLHTLTECSSHTSGKSQRDMGATAHENQVSFLQYENSTLKSKTRKKLYGF